MKIVIEIHNDNPSLTDDITMWVEEMIERKVYAIETDEFSIYSDRDRAIDWKEL